MALPQQSRPLLRHSAAQLNKPYALAILSLLQRQMSGQVERVTAGSERSRLGVSWPVLFVLLVYAVALPSYTSVLGDPDTYWHVVIGRWIIAHRAVPHRDLWSFTKLGAPFTPREWLGEVILAWLQGHFGWAGLVAVSALSGAAALGMLLRRLLRYLPPTYALGATALAWIFISHALLARPLIFTPPILVAWVGALVDARRRDHAPPLWLVPLMLLWANLHGSFMMGLALAALLAAEALFMAADRRARFRVLRDWGVFGAASLAAAAATPSGIGGLLAPFELMRMSFLLSHILEWMSPDFQSFQPLEVWLLTALLAGFCAGWRLPLSRVLMVLLLVHLALNHIRLGGTLAFAGTLLLAPALGTQIEGSTGGRLVSRLDRFVDELARPASAAGLAIAGLMLAAATLVLLPRHLPPREDAITPRAALAAVAKHHVSGPVLNDYRFGGYLIYRGIKPFIDGRADFYGDAFLKRYEDAMKLTGGQLLPLLKQYHITWTLLGPDQPAVALLDHLPGWRRLYADRFAVVHVRVTPSAMRGGPASQKYAPASSADVRGPTGWRTAADGRDREPELATASSPPASPERSR